MSFSFKKNVQRETPKFKYLKQSFGNKTPFKLLDIGSGNHSASKTVSLFPNCEYSGVDIQKDFNNDESDYRVMKDFFEMDLTLLDFSALPDNNYDFIRMAHVIEHLKNGDEVILGLLPKLKKGGYLYIEFPAERSTKLPSMYGTLNFYDDGTHVRIYSAKEISELLVANGCKVKSAGIRRNMYFLAATPFRVAKSVFSREKISGNFFWDLLGFADYVYAQKN